MGKLFKKYGKLSMEDLKKTAAGLKDSGEKTSLMTLAKENGIEKEDIQDYLSGGYNIFESPMLIALARIDVEEEALTHKEEIVQDWINYIRGFCEKEDAAIKIMNPDKSIEGCIAKLLEWSFENSYKIDKSIMEKVSEDVRKKVGESVREGIPGTATAKRLIKKYYEI